MKAIKYYLVSLFCLSILSFGAKADQMFTMDQITGSIQSDYRAQLNKKVRLVRKRKTRTSSSAKVPANWVVLLQERQSHRKARQGKVTPRPHHVPSKSQVMSKPDKPSILHQGNLFDAASNGSVQNIAQLLKQGINVNVANPERETALHMAAAKGHYSAAIYLINHGANIHARTINNWLPIHHATRFRHVNIANYLIKRGSSPHARTSDGLSAIDMARALRDQRLLVLFGAK